MNFFTKSVQSFLIGLHGEKSPDIDWKQTATNLTNNLQAAPKILQLFFVLAFLFYDFVRPIFSFRFIPLRFVSDAQKGVYIDRWFLNPVFPEKLILTGLKYLCVTEIYVSESIQSKMGYEPFISRRKNGEC